MLGEKPRAVKLLCPSLSKVVQLVAWDEQKIDLGSIARTFGLDPSTLKLNGHFISRGVDLIASSVTWKSLLSFFSAKGLSTGKDDHDALVVTGKFHKAGNKRRKVPSEIMQKLQKISATMRSAWPKEPIPATPGSTELAAKVKRQNVSAPSKTPSARSKGKRPRSPSSSVGVGIYLDDSHHPVESNTQNASFWQCFSTPVVPNFNHPSMSLWNMDLQVDKLISESLMLPNDLAKLRAAPIGTLLQYATANNARGVIVNTELQHRFISVNEETHKLTEKLKISQLELEKTKKELAEAGKARFLIARAQAKAENFKAKFEEAQTQLRELENQMREMKKSFELCSRARDELMQERSFLLRKMKRRQQRTRDSKKRMHDRAE